MLTVDVLMIVSNVATDLLECALTDITLGVLTDVGVAVSVDSNVNVFAGVMTEVTFAMPAPIDNFSCLAAFDCRSMDALDCARVTQAQLPSYHV